MFAALVGWSVAVDDGVVEVATGHTSGRMTGRIEVVARVSGRRGWSVEQKLSMLRDAFGPGGSVRGAMERHEVTSGQLYTWRRQAMSGELAATPRPALAEPALMPAPPCFAEVCVAHDAAPPMLSSAIAPAVGAAAGRMVIELPSGVRVTVDESVAADALGRVLTALGR